VGYEPVQFTAGPLVFRDFVARVVDVSGDALPNNLAFIPVMPLDVGGFTLATTCDGQAVC